MANYQSLVGRRVSLKERTVRHPDLQVCIIEVFRADRGGIVIGTVTAGSRESGQASSVYGQPAPPGRAGCNPRETQPTVLVPKITGADTNHPLAGP